MQTTVFESISAVIPSADPTDVLPTVPVIAGWNLLGVVDISQGAAGSEPIGKEEADDYFVSIDWRVGYYFRNEVERLAEDRPGRRAVRWRGRDSERQGLLDLVDPPGQAGPVKRARSPDGSGGHEFEDETPPHRGRGLSLGVGVGGGELRGKGEGGPSSFPRRREPRSPVAHNATCRIAYAVAREWRGEISRCRCRGLARRGSAARSGALSKPDSTS